MFKIFGKNHNRFYSIKETVHKLSDDDFNYIADKVLNIPSDKRGLLDVFKSAGCIAVLIIRSKTH